MSTNLAFYLYQECTVASRLPHFECSDGFFLDKPLRSHEQKASFTCERGGTFSAATEQLRLNPF